LEKHQALCDYQTQQCSGCQLLITKKDFSQHVSKCTSIELTWSDCKLVFIRGDISEPHTNAVCLKEQFRQDFEENKRKFEKQSEEYKRELQKLRQDNDEYIRQIKKIEDYLRK
jgi:hypothetical protein